jgi:hypothetical protein
MGQVTLRPLKRMRLDAQSGCYDLRRATLASLLKDR